MDKRNDTDILRAEDIIPPFNQKKEPPQKQSSNDKTPAKNTSEIPEFDLAKQIMAQHRKNASTKRKAPEKKEAKIKRSTSGYGQKISPEYNGVQNVIERAFLSHQKKQSIPKSSERKTNITSKAEPNNLGLEPGFPTTALGAGWSPESYSDTNETQKIISEIVARDIKKLISGI